jgi:uncharacterized membrane protein
VSGETSARRTALFVSVVSLAAGVGIATYYYILKTRRQEAEVAPLESVSDLLNECYIQMRELQARLNDLNMSPKASPVYR